MPEPLRDLKIQTLSQSGPKYEPGWEFVTIDELSLTDSNLSPTNPLLK